MPKANATAPSTLSGVRRKAFAVERTNAATAASAARGAASKGRHLAEGEPRPDARGRPRRDAESAALYNFSMRMTPAERAWAKEQAHAQKISLADFVRLQVFGTLREPLKPTYVYLPAHVDQEYLAEIKKIGKNVNRLTVFFNMAAQASHLTTGDREALGNFLTKVQTMIVKITPPGDEQRSTDAVRSIPMPLSDEEQEMQRSREADDTFDRDVESHENARLHGGYF